MDGSGNVKRLKLELAFCRARWSRELLIGGPSVDKMMPRAFLGSNAKGANLVLAQEAGRRCGAALLGRASAAPRPRRSVNANAIE